MGVRRIDWAAWDVSMAAAKDYILWLTNRVSQENIDTLFTLLPEGFQDVSIEYDQRDLSKVAAVHLLEFLPIVAAYDYDICFKGSLARMTLRHRNRISIIFGFDDVCSVSADDRVGNAFLYGGSSKKFALDSKGNWRTSLETAVLSQLGKGFL